MAGEQVFISSFKEKLQDQLTCSVCLDQYTNPKILPCHHSFCLMCIEPIPVEIKDEKHYISCPTCRVDHQLPQGGANNLPNDFKINTLLDLRKSLDTTPKQNLVSTPKQNLVSTPDPTLPTCPEHNNDLLKFYCETCCQVICRACTMTTNHSKHKFYLISECYPEYLQLILDNLHQIKHKLADMDTAMAHLATREREVIQQGANIKEEINQHAQKLLDSIQQSRTHLTQQVDTIVQQKTQTLATQRQQAQKLHTQLQTCQDTIEYNLKEWTQQQIVVQKYTMMHEMNTATQHVDPIVFQPIENANIKFNINESSQTIGTITSKAYSRAILEASPCLAKQPSSATLTLQSLDGSPFPLPPSLISSTLSSPDSEHSVKCPITQTQPGKHDIAFTPTTRRGQLIVQVGGVDVPDSPFTLSVIPGPTLEMRGEPVNTITGLNRPLGVAVRNNGDIVVVEQSSHCITILNNEGERLKSFGGGEGVADEKFNHPRGVAISNDGFILLSDSHRIRKVTTDGVCVKSIGTRTKGSGRLQFNTANGIAVHPTTGQIFVADSLNNRIQVFTNDLIFSHTITSTLFHRFNSPHDVAIDNHGYIYVAEWANHCVAKLSETGKFLKRFASKGSDPGQLYHPTSLTTINNLVYVCDSANHRVSVFDTDGNFLSIKAELRYPWGLAIGNFGKFYVSDSNKKIVVF